MKCQTCGHIESKVVDSRAGGSYVRRRRECLGCGLRTSTIEIIKTVSLKSPAPIPRLATPDSLAKEIQRQAQETIDNLRREILTQQKLIAKLRISLEKKTEQSKKVRKQEAIISRLRRSASRSENLRKNLYKARIKILALKQALKSRPTDAEMRRIAKSECDKVAAKTGPALHFALKKMYQKVLRNSDTTFSTKDLREMAILALSRALKDLSL